MQLSPKIQLITKEAVNTFLIPISFNTYKILIKPTVAAFYLTSRCNSRCNMCNFWRPETVYNDELKTEEIKSILLDIKNFGINVISFSAEGEMFVRNDVFEILEYAKELGLLFGINTNGLNVDEEKAKRLKDLDPTTIMISVDTAKSERYSMIRGIPKGLERVSQAVKTIQKTGYENLNIGAVILLENADELIDIVNLGNKWNVKSVRFTAFQQFGFSKDWDIETLKKYKETNYINTLKESIEKLIEYKEKNGLIANSVDYLKMIIDFYLSDHYYPVNCIQGYYKIKIMPNGDLSICPIMRQTALIGNLKRYSLEDLWYSNKANDIRNIIKEGKCPGCWLSCYGEDNLRFSLKYGFRSSVNTMKRASSLLF